MISTLTGVICLMPFLWRGDVISMSVCCISSMLSSQWVSMAVCCHASICNHAGMLPCQYAAMPVCCHASICYHAGRLLCQFADDTQLFISVDPKSSNISLDILNICSVDVLNSFTHISLSLNPSKTEVRIMGTRQMVQRVGMSSVPLAGCDMKRCDNLKGLSHSRRTPVVRRQTREWHL